MNEREIKALVRSTVKECRQFFREQGWCSSTWDVKVTTSFAGRRNRSWGGARRGVPFISLALSRYVSTTDSAFHEYRSFRYDKDIGTIVGNTTKAIKALVVHEMSHALQFSGSKDLIAASVGTDIKKNGVGGHGEFWKGIYRAARKALVNDDTVQILSKPVVVPGTLARNTMKRAEALQWISDRKRHGWTNQEIIHHMVVRLAFKRTTATTYTYSVQTFHAYRFNN
jgi:hypothetical protein